MGRAAKEMTKLTRKMDGPTGNVWTLPNPDPAGQPYKFENPLFLAMKIVASQMGKEEMSPEDFERILANFKFQNGEYNKNGIPRPDGAPGELTISYRLRR